MSENKIKIELNDELSEGLYLKYECRKDKYNSFDDFLKDFEEYINLMMKKTNLEGELKRVNDRIGELKQTL